MVWAAQRGLSIRGDLAEAYRMADEAVSMRGGVFQSSALTARACVEVAQGVLEDADADARESAPTLLSASGW